MAVVEISERQILATGEAAVVGILENPCFGAAFSRVKLIRLIKDFKKDILHHIFCFGRVTKNSQSDLQDKPVKAIKQRRQGIRMPVAKLLHHVFVSHFGYSDSLNPEGGSRRVWDNGWVMHYSTLSSYICVRERVFVPRVEKNCERIEGLLVEN